MPNYPADRRVHAGGTSLAVRERSPRRPGRPTLVLVHGYPDQQEVWDAVVAALPLDDLHVVTYDVRGAGASDVPPRTVDYRVERLVDDLVAVLDATVPDGGPVHLVGHDWGSVQLWDAVAAEGSDPRLRGRIASFTSISGPSLDHLAWLVRHPRGRLPGLVRQALRSWYVYAFQLPWLPELAWRRGAGLARTLVTAREGLPVDHFGENLARNAVNGLNLYRANLRAGRRRAGPLRTGVPVLVIHPLHDAFVTSVTVEDLHRGCPRLRVEEIDAGHWVIRTHPERVADLVREHVLLSGRRG